MDMKFTCPACKKVHRVTITISTPGEAAPAVRKTQPVMPKKYATGAYAPVVDIPIDADFVLFDGKGGGKGVDLGQAAPFIDRKMSERKTEFFRDPPKRGEPQPKAAKPAPTPEPVSAPGPSPEFAAKPNPAPEPEPAREPQTEAASGSAAEKAPGQTMAETGKSAALRDWLTDADTPGAVAEQPHAAQAGPPPMGQPGASADPEPATGTSGRAVWESGRYAKPSSRRKPRRRKGPAVALFLAALILAGAGYLGWQQHRFDAATAALGERLAAADRRSRDGDFHAAAAEALLARDEQAGRSGMKTVENLWNGIAPSVGLAQLGWTDYRDAEQKIDAHLRRERLFDQFIRDVDEAEPDGIAPALMRFTDAAAGDPLLLRAAGERAVNAALELASSGETTPEESLNEGRTVLTRLSPLLDPPARERLENELDANIDRQGERLREEFRFELADIAALGRESGGVALDRYAAIRERAVMLPMTLHAFLFDTEEPYLPALADEADLPAIEQISKLTGIIDEATALARGILSAEAPIDGALEYLAEKAGTETTPNPALAAEAARRVDAAEMEADLLLSIREDLYFRLQSENRRGEISPGAMIAWSLIRPAFGDPRVRIDPRTADFGPKASTVDMIFQGVPLRVTMSEEDYETAVRADAYGFSLHTGWSPLFYKPLAWLAGIARGLRKSGVDPAQYPEWKVVEGPGGLAAVTPRIGVSSATAYGIAADSAPDRLLYFDGGVHRATDLPPPGDADAHGDAFRKAAQRLHEGIMADESIPQPLRQALAPVLMGAYLPIDPRDYLDTEFCRRLIEADYLDYFIEPLSPARRAELAEYREALGKLEAGYDVFVADLGDGRTLYATARLEDEAALSSPANDQDPDTGESLPDYEWRLEEGEKTVFYSPLPMRYVYAFSLAERYHGEHRIRPPGVPERVEVWHATHGLTASYDAGADMADGSREAWARAIASDVGGQLPPVYGEPGWNFPLHVLIRNDQGDPLFLATPDGLVPSPDFGGIGDADERRAAEDEWLDEAARVLADPGGLGLIFHQFFRYCSDSPLPEMPNLIGSHFGHLDTHQTVYESLERRWVGRLIGDCDDLAEFFQVLTSRQGKLSHVMNLPAHAACGYADRLAEDRYRFVVLQTGNVLQFTGSTLNEAVEAAYRSFDRSGGETHMTMDAVPIFLRFADEETRTPFILSSRIYADRDYSEAMIRVQGYWHEYVFSAAIREMEEMLETDQEVGNIKELGSLYQRVSLYDKSIELRRRELGLVRGDVQATLSTLLEIAQLHFEAKDKEASLAALGEMEAVFRDIVERQDAPTFMRVTSFRSYWAMHMAMLGEPGRAWDILKYDVDAAKGQRGYINSDPLIRTLVILYDKLSLNQSGKGKGAFTHGDASVMRAIGRELEACAARAMFKADDYYNLTIMRYYLLGRFAVAREGRDAALARLLEDGPYPTEQKDHTKRGREITDEDWSWMRIAPTLYLSYAQEMLDPDENPELYDPETARRLLECVARAAEKGAGLGSDIAGSDDLPKSKLMLAFLNGDLDLYRAAMAEVKDKDYSSLYDDAALTFGSYCGLIPLDAFAAWIGAFRDHFPGKQHYFKVVYRAIDKEYFDHALMMANAFAEYFKDEKLLVEEAAYVNELVPLLKGRKRERERANGESADAPAARPAA
jgi:hypothetical protein